MESKDSEKMRQELESFLNDSLSLTECAWPVKHLSPLTSDTQKKDDTGVFAANSSVRH